MATPRNQSVYFKTIIFMVILSTVSALILSVLASALKKPKEIAKELDQSKQMMIAARLLNHEDYFVVDNSEKEIVHAKLEPSGLLVADPEASPGSRSEILTLFQKRLKPRLTNSKGEISTFSKEKIDPSAYLSDYRKVGYYTQPWKLFYEILPNIADESKEEKPIGYVIPINGFGLWDAIYGYIAIAPDADTVIGISWYDQKETPGLGANIAEAPWQNLFQNKKIFQPNSSGKTDFSTAPLGITVVKGKVSEVYGDAPKADNAVDGMAGATLTGNGVTDAYRTVLAAYRPFLLKIHEEYKKAHE